MPTLLQLESEAAWRAEFTPPALLALGVRLAAFFRIPPTAIGTRGNTSHLSGYHRSRRWVKTSAYCVSRTYSVSRTAGDRAGGSDDAVCAMDVTLPATQLQAACQRLDAAVRAGRLEKITEWYGNLDGDQRVDGYDNISNRVASSDPSHLWHLHMSFDRGRVDEDHDDVYEVLTGDDMAEVYYRIQSSDLEWTGKAFVSNRIHRRLLRAPGEIQKAATAGASLVTLTDRDRLGVSATETWATFIEAVAGPEFPRAAPGGEHTHTATTTVGPPA